MDVANEGKGTNLFASKLVDCVDFDDRMLEQSSRDRSIVGRGSGATDRLHSIRTFADVVVSTRHGRRPSNVALRHADHE